LIPAIEVRMNGSSGQFQRSSLPISSTTRLLSGPGGVVFSALLISM
jgi:hypothetical protein